MQYNGKTFRQKISGPPMYAFYDQGCWFGVGFSARSLSEKIEAPFGAGADPFGKEKLDELEALGICPMGRYLGGEPIKPVRLGPEDFFAINKNIAGGMKNKERKQSAAVVLCSGLEFENTHWTAGGTEAELFRGHLEFLRIWGFSGGLRMEKASAASLLADYLTFLQIETARENPKIIVLVSKNFFETQLFTALPNAKTGADTTGGEIPVNFASGGIPVLGSQLSGTGIVLCEDIIPVPASKKIHCDILIEINDAKNKPANYTGDISARLKLEINIDKPEKEKIKKSDSAQKTVSLSNFLCRSLIPEQGKIPPLAFHAETKTDSVFMVRKPDIKRIDYFQKINYEEADSLGILPQWEAGRTESAFGCLFAVNSRFSGLAVPDFKEEQAHFNTESKTKINKIQTPPAIKPGTVFSGLNEIQLDYFLQWRSECRLGQVRIVPDSLYMETYIWLYSGELALCMGKEGPLEHFTALKHLFLACTDHYPETASLLSRWLIDFTAIYGIAAEAFPVLLSELLSAGWLEKETHEMQDSRNLLIDLAVGYFLIESKEFPDTTTAWALIKTLIPTKILERKEKNKNLPEKFCKMLGNIDARLRNEWNKSFFRFFFPPFPVKNNFFAFEKNRNMGESSYTFWRPDFSSHKPLIDILTALVLEPETNPLPEVRVRLNPFNPDDELIEELRKESDAVREILRQEESGEDTGQETEKRDHQRDFAKRKALTEYELFAEGELFAPSFTPPDKTKLMNFISTLEKSKRKFLKSILQNIPVSSSDVLIDSINAAFYEEFGDLLIDTNGTKLLRPSITAEYAAILEEWELSSQNE